ncbi:hypothetical protein Zmor_009586 [Zophobas morio]|uniref:Uncharacterized protein n=1 Tax=Zophobas morio TaxID=2755281 RepID=A0AA38IPD5_9CUCU|nr:hypothetical protein Zmor_009586 [Zophobas morio]
MGQVIANKLPTVCVPGGFVNNTLIHRYDFLESGAICTLKVVGSQQPCNTERKKSLEIQTSVLVVPRSQLIEQRRTATFLCKPAFSYSESAVVTIRSGKFRTASSLADDRLYAAPIPESPFPFPRHRSRADAGRHTRFLPFPMDRIRDSLTQWVDVCPRAGAAPAAGRRKRTADAPGNMLEVARGS